ncbi:NTP transferase domain-containing protein [Shewanella insulae]|uniref:nucleotidyltransferase family protein n=1 Tax=Shewanella insulae TaxID=2681496 RepID=UPI001EFD14E5|nr:NTP transferase domain-containing protein [Shewanella insulae]MCG9755783.1 NTP transferase domain-containing protein [Shewanella insulae]
MTANAVKARAAEAAKPCIQGRVMIALLAAGESRRFGGVKLAQSLTNDESVRDAFIANDLASASSEPKPTESKQPEAKSEASPSPTTLIGHQYGVLSEVASRLGASLCVITGAHHETVASCLPPSATLLHNPDWQGGLGHSIAAAASEARARRAETLLIALGDQLLLGIDDYLGLFRARARADTRVCAYYELTLGAPALFHFEDFEALSTLSGDRGAKALLSQRYQEGSLIAMAMDDARVDIDTRSQLSAYLARSKAGA